MKYVKERTIVDAYQWDGSVPYGDESNLPTWYKDAIFGQKLIWFDLDWNLHVRTLKGDLKADKGDYIVKGCVGDLYICDKKVFEMTYERQ